MGSDRGPVGAVLEQQLHHGRIGLLAGRVQRRPACGFHVRIDLAPVFKQPLGRRQLVVFRRRVEQRPAYKLAIIIAAKRQMEMFSYRSGETPAPPRGSPCQTARGWTCLPTRSSLA
jgi:hypothetical protein